MAMILVTGSAGAVGQPVCRELLRRGHQVRGLDRVASPGLADFVTADIVDPQAVREAVRGVDAVVHLAARPNEAPFAELVGPNVVGLFNVMNAAREERVKRLVVTSSMLVVSPGHAPPRPARIEEAAPKSHYALTKLWAEQMAEMYARCFDMSILAVRLGWKVRSAEEAAKLVELAVPNFYISGRDAGDFFARAVEADGIRFAIVYAAGLGGEKVFDMEPARRLLGYQARDPWPEGLVFETS
jgi:uronate dehydrogenase